MKRNAKGFSLIEALITLTITAIITGVAVPSFSSAIQRKEIKSIVVLLESSLRSARNHAITNQAITLICPLENPSEETCQVKRPSNANWSHGWMVFEDTNKDNNFSEDDQIISIFRNESEGKIVFNQRGRLRFFQDGGARSAGFYICNTSGSELRHVQLLHSGRIRIKDFMTPTRRDICTSVAS